MVRINLIIFGLFLTFNLFGQYPRIILKQLEKADSSGQFIIADSDSNAVWSDALYITTDSLLTLYGDTIEGGINYEKIQDTIAAMLEAGLGIQMTYNDEDGEFLIESLSIEDSIYNGSGSLISKGTPLYAVGTQGNYWNVAPADASDITKLPAVVIAGEDIGIGETGVGLLKGHIKQVNTTGLADGDEVYVAIGGGYTNVKPKGESNYVQRLGTVIKGNDANGSGIINLGEVQSVSNLNAGNIFIGDTDSTITTTVYIVDSSRVNATGDSLIYYQNGVQVGADKLEGGVFVDDGTYVYYNGGKNVGIGTTTPFRELHILNSENNKTVFLIENTQNNPFSTAEIGMLQGSSFFNLVNYSDSASATVSGLSLANKGLLQTSNGMDGIVYAPINGQNYFLYDSRFDSDLLYIDATNDRIGIKDTTPTATLDVTGWVNITDSLVVNDIRVTGSGGGTINGVTTDATLTGDGTSGTPLKVDTSIIATQGDLSDYVTIAGTETITGAKTFTSTTTVDANLVMSEENASVIGQTDGTIQRLSVDGVVDELLYYRNRNSAVKDSMSILSGWKSLAGSFTNMYAGKDTTLVIDATNNRVGIGTSTPSATLDVVSGAGKLAFDGTRLLLYDSASITDAYNVFIGEQSGNENAKDLNVAIGYRAGRLLSSTARANVYLGGYAAGLDTLTGYWNLGIGYSALYSLTSGIGNLAFGTNALDFVTTGSDNVGIGFIAGRNLTTGSNNIYIGASALPNSATVTNEIVIGSSRTGRGSNTISLGNTSITSIAGQVSFSTYSDFRDKKNISNLEDGLNLLMKLRPVKFVWNTRDGGKVDVNDIGFIAQEVDGVQYQGIDSDYINIVNYNELSDEWTITYDKFIPLLTKAIQEQQAIIETQASEIDQLKTLITDLTNRLTILENK